MAMDTNHEPSNNGMQLSRNTTEQSNFLAWINEQLSKLAVIFGQNIIAERRAIYVTQLADIPREQLARAFDFLSRNSEFFPTIAKIRQACGNDSASTGSAEARLAWDELEKFVKRYVDCDVFGNFGPEHGWHATFPKLSPRILDTVRRTGGWKVYKTLTDDAFPFQQKRFFEEYAAWAPEQFVSVERLLTPAPTVQQLTGEVEKREPLKYPPVKPHTIKPIPQPMSDAQIRDRKEILRQQAELLRNRKPSGDAA